jgi:hypothetical protein
VSVFLLNAVLLFAGVIAFIAGGLGGTFVRRLRPLRYRLLLAPLGFVVCGGICISAEQHLLRWIEGGHLRHTFSSGIVQGVVLLASGVCGLLAGVGLGSSLDQACSAADAPSAAPHAATRREPRRHPAKVISISNGRQPGVVPRIRSGSDHD